MKQAKSYTRFTLYDNESNRYYVNIQLSYNLKYKKNVMYREFTRYVDRLAEFENLLKKYKVNSLYELEQILENQY